MKEKIKKKFFKKRKTKHALSPQKPKIIIERRISKEIFENFRKSGHWSKLPLDEKTNLILNCLEEGKKHLEDYFYNEIENILRAEMSKIPKNIFKTKVVYYDEHDNSILKNIDYLILGFVNFKISNEIVNSTVITDKNFRNIKAVIAAPTGNLELIGYRYVIIKEKKQYDMRLMPCLEDKIPTSNHLLLNKENLIILIQNIKMFQ